MSYIFLVGAPGSRWSGVAAHIYESADIDQSDAAPHREYLGGPQLSDYKAKHSGSYFDPGMEFGNWFDSIDKHNKKQNESEFNKPFSGILRRDKYRIIKSHTLAHNLQYIKTEWPNSKIVLAYRTNKKCYDWWMQAGGFEISYPSYEWYENEKKMKAEIALQNKNIKAFMSVNKAKFNAIDSFDTCNLLNIKCPIEGVYQSYKAEDIKVCVI